MRKFVFYGGKGGVGKTTCAAATGIAFAERGERTLVVSTDPAHSLSDAFGIDPDRERREVAANLWIEEVGPEGGERAIRSVVETLAAELRSAGIRLDEPDVERLFAVGMVPGSDELAALELLAGLVDDEFDRVVVDTAPTGHTLRLLDLPDVLREGVAAASTLRGQLRQFVDTARGAVFGPGYYMFGRRAEDADELQGLGERMEEVRSLLRDPDRTEFRAVCIPEPMVVAETSRLLDQLRDFGIAVDTLVVNRVATDVENDCGRCSARAKAHEEELARIRERFADLDIIEVPEYEADTEPRKALEDLAPLLDLA